MKAENIIKKLKSQLELSHPGLLKNLIIFGSSARNTNNPDSDIDILLILNNAVDWKLKDNIYEIIASFNVKYDIWIDVSIIEYDELNSVRGRQPYILNALKEGIII